MLISRRTVPVVLALLTALLATACGSDSSAGGDSGEDGLVVYSGRNEGLVAPILERFESETGVEVSARYAGTAELAAQLQEEGERTAADVFFAQDAGALGALSQAGRFAPIPEETLQMVDGRFRAVDGTWVGVSGRARVLAYDPEQVPEADVPDSVLELTEPQWSGKVGYAPTNASFQAFVTAMRELLGEERTKQWLEGMKANDIQAYDNNIAVLDAVDRGEVSLGLINHYYWYEKVAEQGEDAVRARIKYLPGGDPGALVNVAGVGVLKGTDRPDEAQQLVEFLLSAQAQEYFATETMEYPLVDGVATAEDLPPLDSLEAPEIDLARLESLEETLALLEEVGLT